MRHKADFHTRKAPEIGEVWTNTACNNFVVVAKTNDLYIVTAFYHYKDGNMSECWTMTISEFMKVKWNGVGYGFAYVKLGDTFEDIYP